jgi:hypothetical protein
VQKAREARLKAIQELTAEENDNENQGESEGEERKHVIERCVGGVAIGGTESWIAKTKLISPVGVITSCAFGIYGPILAEGIQSVLE